MQLIVEGSKTYKYQLIQTTKVKFSITFSETENNLQIVIKILKQGTDGF